MANVKVGENQMRTNVEGYFFSRLNVSDLTLY